eukprot:6134259-Prymnesium_polylepis.1
MASHGAPCNCAFGVEFRAGGSTSLWPNALYNGKAVSFGVCLRLLSAVRYTVAHAHTSYEPAVL